MKSKWISRAPRTLVVVFEEGDEIVSGLKQAAEEHRSRGAFDACDCLADTGGGDRGIIRAFEAQI